MRRARIGLLLLAFAAAGGTAALSEQPRRPETNAEKEAAALRQEIVLRGKRGETVITNPGGASSSGASWCGRTVRTRDRRRRRRTTKRFRPFRPEDAIEYRVLFDFDSAFIRPEGAPALREMCAFIRDGDPARRFDLIGHTDASGPGYYNLRLSLQRALAVRAWLAERCGVGPKRFTARGRGERELIPEARPDSAAQRRVELRLRLG